MAVQMTRAEYEAKYKVAPSAPVSVLSQENPAPVKMTRAEYQLKYDTPAPSIMGTLLGPLNEGISGLKTLYGGGEQGIANKLKTDVTESAKNIEKGKLSDFVGFNSPMGVLGIGGETGKGIAKAGLRTAGDVAGAVYAPIGAAIGATGIGHVFNYLGELSQKGGQYNPINALTDMKAVQDFIAEHPNAEEDFGRALNLGLAGMDKGKIEPSTIVPRTIEQVKATQTKAGAVYDTYKAKQQTDLVQQTADEIAATEARYAKGRKANLYSKDAGADSRQRIAQSGVLKNSVNEDGLVQTQVPGGAVEKYQAMTTKPAEGVVRTGLAREGGKTNLSVVQQELNAQVNSSGLEGADLVAALNAVKKEMAGLRLKADQLGYVDNTLLHDAKINTTDNINYQTPPEVSTYRKAVARAYKKLVEVRDGATFDAGKVNAELAKYYDDIERLKRLNGNKVIGGRLGKYTAQISGNIVGGAFGGMVGGPAGMAIGTVVGGETAAFIRGKSMAKTFNADVKEVPPKSAILEKLIEDNKTPPKPQSNILGNRNTIYQTPKASSKNSISPKSTTIPKELQPLAKEAQKYSSAEEAIQAKYVGDMRGAKVTPLDYSALDNDGRWTTQKIATEFKVTPDRVHQLNISLDELPSPKYEGPINPDEMPRISGQPAVKVEIAKDGRLKILDGNHRIDQAIENGDTHIPAWVVDKSQLTDFYNRVRGEK